MTTAKSSKKAKSNAPFTPEDIRNLTLAEKKVRWLATWMIHHANHIRPSVDGLKVGGHQASCASMSAMMTALFLHQMKTEDMVAVKPHASPVMHALHYLLGNQSLEQLENFRAFGGAQSYPSRTKDKDPIDFSTGSVGLGVAITAFSSLVQDYLSAHRMIDPGTRRRMIALLGDGELDEGNIYEALIECYKHDVRNVWWVIDYNRQSLDAVTSDRMFTRYGDIFSTAGWTVITLKYGKKLEAAFARPGGERLEAWIDKCPNQLYSALSYEGGAAWRGNLLEAFDGDAQVRAILDPLDDDALGALMTDLGGHCMETLLEAFASVDTDAPHVFIAYTVKGKGLPFQGHKDNHAGLMNKTQLVAYQAAEEIEAGLEWEPFAGLSEDEAGALEGFLAGSAFAKARLPQTRPAQHIPVPARGSFPLPEGEKQATQGAFGRILNDLARQDTALAERIVTTSPDVTVSTNLGGWVNGRGIFNRAEVDDVFSERKIPTPQKWDFSRSGQHIELGIAENNLFLLLAALGLSAEHFGERLLPIGTLYDPFIARGLDALNYACYQDARFMLVATPSGITLGPEGGAHQSIGSPLIGMAQPGLTYFEPAYVDELSAIMGWGFEHMQAENGGSVYLRLTTRELEQPRRTLDDGLHGDILSGAYWLQAPAEGAELAIIYCGAIAPEARAAFDEVLDDIPGAGLMAVTSPDLLHRDWMGAHAAHWKSGGVRHSHIENLLTSLSPQATLVTVLDGAATTLSWIGGVKGHKTLPLGVDRFGQSGSLVDLYDAYRIDANAILDACASGLAE